jgi:hypothetical protein
LDGQQVPTDGQVPSLTSGNNFVNFCATVKKAITNGLQVKEGSCNPIPMGRIIRSDKLPNNKFVEPANFSKIKANTPFTIKMALNNLQAGFFTNAAATYYGAPAEVNGDGIVIGHSHVTIQKIPSLDTTDLIDPVAFAFFKGLNEPLNGGQLTTDVTAGLPAGVYRMCSINSSSNHQPVLASVAQHGSMDDCNYFTCE